VACLLALEQSRLKKEKKPKESALSCFDEIQGIGYK